MTKILIAVVGPTAIGKTALAIELAKHFKTEIVSADSRQFYKEMNIGTAVPSKEELNSAPHNFIQHKSIHEKYSVGDFEKEAIALLENLFQDNDVVILVGGSGLYIDAVIYGLDDFPEVPVEIRENLSIQLNSEGLESLQELLKVNDPLYYEQVDLENPHRVIRALEICLSSGKPYSSFLNKKKTKRAFDTIYVGISAEREIIYGRINQRVDKMIEEGLLEEVKRLIPYKTLNALQTVGYKELFDYLDGKSTLEDSIEEIKKNTRRFAKRQLTWYRKNENIVWFDYEEPIENVTSKLNLMIGYE